VEEVSVSNPESDPTPITDAKTAPAKKATPKKAKEPAKSEFLAEQRQLLLEERASYTKQAEELKAEADSLALEHEPGDVQFDEEGGEGGTSNVDRELDLLLSAQARGAVVEIDRALAKIDTGHYGVCEQCGQPIPQARLMALPYASLCVACKSGGLSRR
jgi:DnaK suppressor protein